MSVAPHADGGCFKHASYVAGVQLRCLRSRLCGVPAQALREADGASIGVGAPPGDNFSRNYFWGWLRGGSRQQAIGVGSWRTTRRSGYGALLSPLVIPASRHAIMPEA